MPRAKKIAADNDEERILRRIKAAVKKANQKNSDYETESESESESSDSESEMTVIPRPKTKSMTRGITGSKLIGRDDNLQAKAEIKQATENLVEAKVEFKEAKSEGMLSRAELNEYKEHLAGLVDSIKEMKAEMVADKKRAAERILERESRVRDFSSMKRNAAIRFS